MTCGVYQIYNRANDKQYIGSSVNIEKRWISHCCALNNQYHKNSHLQKAWNKYGKDSFNFSLIEECDIDQIIEKEQWYVDNTPNLYNIAKNVEKSSLGIHFSDEHKRKIGEAQKWRTVSEEQKKRLRKLFLGRTHSEQTRQKMSGSHKGHAQPESVREKIRKLAIGRVPSEETRQKISKANTGKIRSDEVRMKMAEVRKNIYHPKGIIPSIDTRRKMGEARKGKIHSRETRTKMSDSRKLWWENRKSNKSEK